MNTEDTQTAQTSIYIYIYILIYSVSCGFCTGDDLYGITLPLYRWSKKLFLSLVAKFTLYFYKVRIHTDNVSYVVYLYLYLSIYLSIFIYIYIYLSSSLVAPSIRATDGTSTAALLPGILLSIATNHKCCGAVLHSRRD